jgi:hypothetical protein
MVIHSHKCRIQPICHMQLLLLLFEKLLQLLLSHVQLVLDIVNYKEYKSLQHLLHAGNQTIDTR